MGIFLATNQGPGQVIFARSRKMDENHLDQRHDDESVTSSSGLRSRKSAGSMDAREQELRNEVVKAEQKGKHST